MKSIHLVAIAATMLCSLNVFAAGKTLVSCQGGSLEGGAEIEENNGRLEGSMQWDCFPGDGICSANAVVAETRTARGDVVFEGPSFRLIILTTNGQKDGYYKSLLTTKDTVDPADEGGGFTFNQYVSCKE